MHQTLVNRNKQEKNTQTTVVTLCIFVFIGLVSCEPQIPSEIDKAYLLPTEALAPYESDIDHQQLVKNMSRWSEDWDMRQRATTIYRSTCFSCHGNNEQPGSLPNSKKFWQDSFANGHDPYAMYQTITRGFGQMPPHPHLVPEQKYDVINFIREELIKPHNEAQYFEISNSYINQLPKGNSTGPDAVAYEPWKELDYGNWLMRCYEMSDDDDPPKVIATGRAPLKNEDYSQTNFAYKGIAMRLDTGTGGIADGHTFALFDHDLMRFVGAWAGTGFIDWEDILLDDQHNVYPRTIGERLFANPITPGWANPETGDFEDPRFLGSDGRPFGPLPRSWSHYKGLYRYDNHVIIHYTVDRADVLECYSSHIHKGETIIGRTIRISNVTRPLKLRLIPADHATTQVGGVVEIVDRDGYQLATFGAEKTQQTTFYHSNLSQEELESWTKEISEPEDLNRWTQGSAAINSIEIQSPIISGNDSSAYAVDILVVPKDNPYQSRMRLTGIDFLKDGQEAVASTIDGEVWKISGLTATGGSTTWKRIATGLFQPLGIKVRKGEIFVGCRDQIVVLRDLNGDEETDYYESFNSDHQVTEHFHEFAMGLQTDEEGNFYYAKSGRHARTSLVPQHGTLLRVSADGLKTDILANGFRAANGVCLNPDGSFYVTDQQGYWNPMNRINRVTEGGFYGNMWGYDPPSDSSDAAMRQPMCWIDMKYDRSPSELLWVSSERWGPLSGSLLNLSYGYGKIFHVLTQQVGDIQQGGMIEIPIPQFPTGIMRGRVNPSDGQLYICGMAAWATSRMIQVGGLYRVRYTGKKIHLPASMEVSDRGIHITFTTPLDPSSATDQSNYTVGTWDLKRTRKYGSDRFNKQELAIDQIRLMPDMRSVFLEINDIAPTWIMEIAYALESDEKIAFTGSIQNTIHILPEDELNDQDQPLD